VGRLTPILNPEQLQNCFSVNDALYDNVPVQTSVPNNPTLTDRVGTYKSQIEESTVDVDVNNANADVIDDVGTPEDETFNKYLLCYTSNILDLIFFARH